MLRELARVIVISMDHAGWQVLSMPPLQVFFKRAEAES